MVPENATLMLMLMFFCPANTVSYRLSSVKDGHFMVGWFSSELVVHSLTSLESFTPSCLYQESALVSATFHDCEIDLPHHLSGPFLRNEILERTSLEQCLGFSSTCQRPSLQPYEHRGLKAFVSCRSQFRIYKSAKFDVLSSVDISMKYGSAWRLGVGNNRKEHLVLESVVWNQSF